MGNKNSIITNEKDFKTLMQQANQVITCDSACQKQKTSEELKQKYLASKTNLASADNQVVVAEKNYVTFTQGELAYNNKKEQELHTKAKLVVSKFQDNFNNDTKQIKAKIDTYNGIIANLSNIIELYSTYKNENIQLSKQVKEHTSSVLTNERKTYYENQGIDNLKFIYY